MAKEKWVQRSGADYAQGFNNLLPTGVAWPRQPDAVLQKVISGLSAIWGDPVETEAALLLTIESDPRITTNLLPEWERAWGLPDKCLAEPLTIGDRRTALVQKMTLLGAQSRAFFIAVAAHIGYPITITEYRPFMVGVDRCGDNRSTGIAPVGFSGAGAGGQVQLAMPSFYDFGAIGFKNGDSVLVAGVGGTTEANGTYLIDVGPNYINLRGTTFIHAWTSGGTITNLTRKDRFGNPLLNTLGIAVAPGEMSEYPYMLGPPENRFYWTVHVGAVRLTWFRVTAGQTGIDPHLRIALATDLECLLRRYKPAQTAIIFDYSGLAVGGSMAGTP